MPDIRKNAYLLAFRYLYSINVPLDNIYDLAIDYANTIFDSVFPDCFERGREAQHRLRRFMY